MAGGEGSEGLRERFSASKAPGAAERTEVIDGRDVIIAQHQEGVQTFLTDLLLQGIAKTAGILLLYGAAGRGQIEIAPVDGNMVAGVAEHLLLGLSDEGGLKRGKRESIAHKRGRHLAVIAQLGGGKEAKGDGMGLSVQRAQGKVHEGDRGGQGVQVIGQGRGPEGHGEFNARGLQDADRTRCRDRQGDGAHGGAGALPEIAVFMSVNDDVAIQVLGCAGPVNGLGAGERIPGHPDGEIGVVGDEGQGGQAIHRVVHWVILPLWRMGFTGLPRRVRSA